MLWYAIQTFTGREEKLVEMIRRVVPAGIYGECFVAYYEQLWHCRQKNEVHILRLFPGYVFISTDEIERMYQCLKDIPAMSRIMASEAFAFSPLYEKEAAFLMDIMDEDHVVRLSYAATDGRNHVSYLSGPLEKCAANILAYEFGKRYALIRLQIAGQDKDVRLGIILNNDIRRETAYGKVEALIAIPERYSLAPAASGKKAEPGAGQISRLAPGDNVAVIDGAFEGNIAVISQVRKDAVRILVHLFEREISAEVPAGSVRRLA